MEADQLKERSAAVREIVESIGSATIKFQLDIQDKLNSVLEQVCAQPEPSAWTQHASRCRISNRDPEAMKVDVSKGSKPLSNDLSHESCIRGDPITVENVVKALPPVPEAPGKLETLETDPLPKRGDRLRPAFDEQASRSQQSMALPKAAESLPAGRKSFAMVKKSKKALRLDARWVGLQLVSSLPEPGSDAQEDPMDRSTTATVARTSLSSRLSLRSQAPLATMASIFRNPCRDITWIIHPHSTKCIVWDCIGLVLLLYDVVAIPLTVAWDLTLEGVTLALCFVSVAYWTVDVIRTFFTGVYITGQLVLDKWRIAKAYMCSWFLIDLSLILIDYVVLSMPSDNNSSLRVVRVFRLLRLSRSLKVKKRFEVIAEACNVSGGCLIILVIAFMQTFLAIVLGAHIVACTWFYIGKISLDNGQGSWLISADLHQRSMREQYPTAFHWVLCQFTPAPIAIGPTNLLERSFNIVIVVFSLAVMGSLVSQMGATMQKLRAMSSENAKKLQDVRRYLYSNSIPIELAARIMRFADFSLQNRRAVALDHGLISASLQKELLVQQRQPLVLHPLFALLEESSPNIFADICGVTNHSVYGKDDVVFTSGALAQGLVITISGTYELQIGGPVRNLSTFGSVSSIDWAGPDPLLLSGNNWFAEVSLFCSVLHSATLTADTIGDVFHLSGLDLVECLRGHVRSSRLVCEYCKGFLGELQWRPEEAVDFLDADVPTNACKATTYYQKQHMHTPIASIEACTHAYPDSASVHTFLQRMLDNELPEEDIADEITKVFPELDPEEGPYARFSEAGGRMCSLASIVSVVWLLKDNYSNFAEPQPIDKRMKLEQWSELQQFMKWADLTIDEIHAVFVFLAIRGLGKVRLLVEQLPVNKRKPEIALQHLMQDDSNLVPSAMRMSEEMRTMVHLNLSLHMHFNFAQMVQAENTPLNVEEIQDYIEEHGPRTLKLYMVSMLAVMCGLAANPSDDTGIIGSRFMGEKMACQISLCIQALQRVGEASPRSIYFGYITARGQLLGMSVTSQDELALARLACLNRVEGRSSLAPIAEAWASLAFSDKEILTDHFLKDGIQEKTILLYHLPLYFASARENVHCGLMTGLSLIADLVVKLRLHPLLQHTHTGQMVVTVDLSDLAMFVSSVQSSSVLLGCIEDAYLDFAVGGSFRLSMTSKNWSRATHDDHNIDIGNAIERMLRKQQAVENIIKAVEIELKSMNVVSSHVSESDYSM